MPENVLEISNLSKRFRLGKLSAFSLRKDLYHWMRNKAGKTDVDSNHPDYFWALKNIDFSVKEGEVLGIIGNNGSGKSTLLKIISRIVHPTTGKIKGRGKVSSILEIGTGFHQELTGRENIFMSGYTLGMTKREIINKFDEIISFSGVEDFLDTPVKRYSSGMYVRLAFSVAAHLEPDILIIDEVLAVGDLDFQQKCLGKIKEVSEGKGRTILFVSHNMQAIHNLCTRVMRLDKGILQEAGLPGEVVSHYISQNKKEAFQSWEDFESAPGNEMLRLKSVSAKVAPGSMDPYISVRTPVALHFEFWSQLDSGMVNINIRLLTMFGEVVFDLGSPLVKAGKGIMVLDAVIPAHFLNDKTYSISLAIIRDGNTNVGEFQNCLGFEVEDVREGMHYFGVWPGITRPMIDSALYMKTGAQ